MLKFHKELILSFCFFVLSTSFSWGEVGFRDLTIGKAVELKKFCYAFAPNKFKCFGIDDLTFSLSSRSEKSKVLITSEYHPPITIAHINSKTPISNGLLSVILNRSLSCNRLIDIDYSNKNNTALIDRFVIKHFWEDLHKLSDTEVCDKAMRFMRLSEIEAQKFRNQNNQKTVTMTHYENRSVEILTEILVDVGPLYQTFLDNIIGDPNNPYRKLKESLDTKYKKDWEFTDRDRKLFNEGEKNSLWTSYSGGEVFSEIGRMKNGSLRLMVHYHTVEDGKKLSEERRSKNADFKSF